MRFASERIAVLCMVALFAGCATAAPRNLGAQAPDASRSPNSEAIANITETDRKMVAAGLNPPEILKYDAELAEMIPEGEDILAKHDKVRAVKWQKRYNAIMKARYDAVQRFAATSIAAANAITNTFGGVHRDTCRDGMGRNTCAAPQSGSRDPQLPDGFSDWCQNPANPTQLVPCNH